jgi:fimbrial chaperone protein
MKWGPVKAMLYGAIGVLGALSAALPAQAQSFEVAISPSRFEVTGRPGGRIGQSLNIFNVGPTPTQVQVRTLDWHFSDQGVISYYEDLQPGSCRPWVTLERKVVSVPARSRANFRFQVDVPPDAPRGECRFMLGVEGVEPAHSVQLPGAAGTQLSLPVSGRIAVAVYVMVGGAQPKLEIKQMGVMQVEGQPRAVVTVANTGDAHGRLEGSLEATDSKGQKFELLPEGTPVLPGQTRTLPFHVKAEPNRPAPAIAFPVKAEGQLDWDHGSFKVTMEFK